MRLGTWRRYLGRHDGVHRDAVLTELFREHARQPVHAAFARDVGELAGAPGKERPRRDVDDPSLVHAVFQIRKTGLSEMEVPNDVGFEEPKHLGLVHL